MGKQDLSEEDIKARYITPAVEHSGWDKKQIRYEYAFTAGRIILRGNITSRGKQKFADYLLFYKPNFPLAIIEAKDNNHPVGAGLQQAIEYAEALDVKFVYASNGDGFVEQDLITGDIRNLSLDEFPSPDELYHRYVNEMNFSETGEKALLEPYYWVPGYKTPRYYQRIAIDRTVNAVARGRDRVLLVCATGTGKTLLAKAVAGEANVPFYFISGSDFVELFVGVGASRVRDMFKQAKHTAPCLIFIDEIDAVGRQRGTGLGGGHDEREQTLNQLLTEMDGFGANEGIIIMAATNRADVLDPALLRPGRFDRQVTVDLPDVREREEILKVHARNKVLAPSVKLEYLAKRTPGFSGAALENLLNEAALLAVRRNKEAITMSEIDEATDRVIGGPAKLSRKYTEHERQVVAYHEAGHAVLGIKLPNAEDVQKITIIPRGQAGGYTLMMPKEETYLATKSELLQRITGLLGGRVSEEIHFKEVTTGAHNDFEKATKIARAMVTEYGMSDLGPVQLEQQEGGVFLGRDYNKTKNFSNEIAHEIDKEVRKIIDSCYKEATRILKENQDLIKLIADALLENETITKEQIDSLVETGHMPIEKEETLTELKAKAKEKGIKGYTKMTKEELEEAIKED